MPATTRSVALVTLGCARNDVDSEELAGRLADAGWTLVDDADGADVAVVNTCGFVEQAKKDSIDTVLAAADLKEAGRTKAVVAVGCMAERYGKDLAESLPEADAVLGFDSYGDLSSHLEAILHGEKRESHVPRDRRTLLPLAPADRQAQRQAARAVTLAEPDLPEGLAPASGPRVVRRRLGSGPWAPVKIAAGCDRRCSFCAIPAFRGSFVSRPADEVLAETRWLAEQGVKEVFLVSENTTSYGKDLGDLRALEALLPQVAAVEGIERVRVSYLQPAEVRPGLLDALTSTPGVVPYFDLSFQHSAPNVLRRMRRFGSTDAFLALLDQVRERFPTAGVRSNVIVGFPGETEADVDELCSFLERARLDVVGIFGYSDEDGTEAATLDGKLPEDVVAARADRVSRLVEELVAQRAEERLGEVVEVLVESVVDEDGDPHVVGRAAHQGPDVDGETELDLPPGVTVAVGDLVRARVTGVAGADLLAEPLVGTTVEA
ncbi:30S ribosomal protein S12 methylthiotransferase RimO [Kineococcus endophyticus]|uniref:Ribosomal protein uS12 methylthiotransferase RimO n=1 Tax=Kineococcus endophyticus TaxID=1181883 RepID=A0ABV3P5I1_9ACTN